MNFHNRKFLILSVPLLVLAIFLGGWFVLREQKASKESPKPSVREENSTKNPGNIESPANVDTSIWKTYRNEEYGFEVKYPGEWKHSIMRPSPAAIGGDLISFNPMLLDENNHQLGFDINIHRSSKTPREWAKANYVEERKDNPDVVISEERDINGYPALFIIHRSMHNGAVNYINRNYIISHKGLILYIHFRPFRPDFPSYEEHIPAFDYMVNSIKF